MAALIALLAITLVPLGCTMVRNDAGPGPQGLSESRWGQGPSHAIASQPVPQEMAPRQPLPGTSPVEPPQERPGAPAVVEVPDQGERGASSPKAAHAEAHDRESAGKRRAWERMAMEIDRLLEARQYRKAVGLLSALIEQSPGAVLLFNRGVASYHLGDFPAALKDFQQALVIDPTLAQAHFGLGVVYLTMGELEHMSQHFQQVLRLAPESPEAQALRREHLVDHTGA